MTIRKNQLDKNWQSHLGKDLSCNEWQFRKNNWYKKVFFFLVCKGLYFLQKFSSSGAMTSTPETMEMRHVRQRFILAPRFSSPTNFSCVSRVCQLTYIPSVAFESSLGEKIQKRFPSQILGTIRRRYEPQVLHSRASCHARDSNVYRVFVKYIYYGRYS